MLCQGCAKLKFRLPAQFSKEDASFLAEHNMEYWDCALKKNKKALKLSKDTCRLCRKIWDGFRNQGNPWRKVDSDAPIYLRIWSTDLHSRDDVLARAFCGGLEVFLQLTTSISCISRGAN